MPLKTHLIATYDTTKREGVTACGEPFYKHPTNYFPDGEYQSVRRIGGLRALDADDFDASQFNDRICDKCRTKRWNR